MEERRVNTAAGAANRTAILLSHVVATTTIATATTATEGNNRHCNIIESPICMVIGSGPGVGYALARTFYKAGFTIVLSRRSAKQLEQDVVTLSKDLKLDPQQLQQEIKGFACDARSEDQITKLFDQVNKELSLSRLKVVIFNVGANVPCSILSESERKFRKIWEMACLGGFLVGKQAANTMMNNINNNNNNSTNKQDSNNKSCVCETIIFTGATASMRGKSHFGAFGSAKAGLRSLAQSMARELGPAGIHVAHVVIDGPINNPNTRQYFGDSMKQLTEEQFIQPDAIAQNYLHLTFQPKNSWTHELDLRTHLENW